MGSHYIGPILYTIDTESHMSHIRIMNITSQVVVGYESTVEEEAPTDTLVVIRPSIWISISISPDCGVKETVMLRLCLCTLGSKSTSDMLVSYWLIVFHTYQQVC